MKKLTHICTFVALFVASKFKHTDAIGSCQDLHFSEYGEGSSYDKWIQVYNPLDEPVDLEGCEIRLFRNNATTHDVPGGVFLLTVVSEGTELEAHTRLTICNPRMRVTNVQCVLPCDYQWTGLTHNGDDPLQLFDMNYDVSDLDGGPIIDQIGIVGEDAPSSGWPVGLNDSGSTKNFILKRTASYETQPTSEESGEVAFRTDEWLTTPADDTSITYPQDCGADNKTAIAPLGPTDGSREKEPSDNNNIWGTGLGLSSLAAIAGAVFIVTGLATYTYSSRGHRWGRGRWRRKRLPSIILGPNRMEAESTTSSEFLGGYLYTSSMNSSGLPKTRAQKKTPPSRSTPLSKLKISARGNTRPSAYSSTSSGESSKYDIPASAKQMQEQTLRVHNGYVDNDWNGPRGVSVGIGKFGRSPTQSTHDEEEDIEVLVANTKAVYYDPSNEKKDSI